MSDIYDTISFLKLKVAETEAYCERAQAERDSTHALLKGMDRDLSDARQLLGDLNVALAQLERIGMTATEGNYTASGSRIKPPTVFEQIGGMFAGLATAVTGNCVKGCVYNFASCGGDDPESKIKFSVGDTFQDSKTGVMFKYSPVLTPTPSCTNWTYKFPMDHWNRLGKNNPEHNMLKTSTLMYIGRL